MVGCTRVLPGLLRLLGCVEALEDDVGELAIHEAGVDIGEDARWLCLDNADIVNATRADSDDFAMHERPDKFGRLADRLDPVIIG